MKRSAGIAFVALLAACSSGNPWDTSGDDAHYRAKTENDRQLELDRPYDPPQQATAPLADPDLEGWRDTVLARADANMLAGLQEWSRMKLQALATRCAELETLEPRLREPQLTETRMQFEKESIRLQMIEQRMAEGAAR